jgi:CheY-like chemotaxis protein
MAINQSFRVSQSTAGDGCRVYAILKGRMELPFSLDDEGPGPPGDGTLAQTILVVDDEPVVREVFVRLLAREQDLALYTADSAEQASVMLRDRRFDLLITDKNLPGKSGIDLIAEARRQWPSLEAVMITAFASAESVIAAFAAGASDYLLKPFDDLQVLRAKVRGALERKGERVAARQAQRAIAQEAASLLARGRDVAEPVWQALEKALLDYEKAIKEGGKGSVLVVGKRELTVDLQAEGFDALRAQEDDPHLELADVVLIDTERETWRQLADRMQKSRADVILLARPEADLADLLEAISLKVDLVGFGGGGPAGLGPRVRNLLMRRSARRAAQVLTEALARFRGALQSSEISR